MKKIVLALALLCGLAATPTAHADAPPDAGAVILPALDAGSASTAPVAAPAPTANPPAILSPEASDIGVVTKLWKGGAFFAIGVIGVYLGLAVWAKLDKKHAWYAATAAGALVVVIESIRKGDTPTAMSVFTIAGPLAGVLIKGPGHVDAPA